jgi:hypothetical protein
VAIAKKAITSNRRNIPIMNSLPTPYGRRRWIVGLIHVQGGTLNSIGNSQLRMLDQFQMGNLVRG